MASEPEMHAVPDEQKDRYAGIKAKFEAKYGRLPTFYARASGRVNLIGEHIDYCGYAVLPMAIEQDIVIAAAPSDVSNISLVNTHSEYQDYKCSCTEIVIDKANPKWFHYFLCGLRGIQDHCSLPHSSGMDVILDGTIPKSAGLSSSSALVCCAALTTARINEKTLAKVDLADVCQHCEHHIGTEGGGMDQAISFLAEPGKAKLIEFQPLRTHTVTLPEGAVFVISNSCVEMNKAATAHFNTRVAECRIATQVLAKLKGLSWRELKKLGDLQSALNATLDDMVSIATASLHQSPYTQEEIAGILGISVTELKDSSLSERTRDVANFQLHNRALHVYSEAGRVWAFKNVCDEGPDDALERLGQLMNESHQSCSQMYECSCPELDQLTQLCRESGALGSRLTGAGWGGCAVSLVPAEVVPSFLTKVTEGYYNETPERKALLSQSLFVTKPGGGAAFYQVE